MPNCHPVMPPAPIGRQSLYRRNVRARRTAFYEFREERWIELYNKKIEEMIGVLRSKGCRCCRSVCQWYVAPRRPRTHCSWIRYIETRPARPASPMLMSGTALLMKPAAFCSNTNPGAHEDKQAGFNPTTES